MKEGLGSQVDAPFVHEDDAVEVYGDVWMEPPQARRGVTLERGEEESAPSILREQPRDRPVAEAAHAVVEHDLRR